MKQMNQRMAAMLLVLVLVTLAVAPASAAKKPWEKIKIPELNEIKMPAYERVELDNGMILYLAEDHEFPLVELSATIDVGSIYEPGRQGRPGQHDRHGHAHRRHRPRAAATTSTNWSRPAAWRVETWIGQTNGGAYLSAMKEDTRPGPGTAGRHPAQPGLPRGQDQAGQGSSRRPASAGATTSP